MIKTLEGDNTSFSNGASASYYWYGDDDKKATVRNGTYAIVLDLTTPSGGSYTEEKYVTVATPPAPYIPPSPPETLFSPKAPFLPETPTSPATPDVPPTVAQI